METWIPTKPAAPMTRTVRPELVRLVTRTASKPEGNERREKKQKEKKTRHTEKNREKKLCTHRE